MIGVTNVETPKTIPVDYAYNSGTIKRETKTLSIAASAFGAASTNGYYAQFNFDGITSNNVICVHTKSYSGSWRFLIWDHYGSNMCLYSNLNTAFSGTVEVFYYVPT